MIGSNLGLGTRLKKRIIVYCTILCILLAATVLMSACVGAVKVSLAQVGIVITKHVLPFGPPIQVDETIDRIIWDIHIPRMLLGALVGMCLAMAGATLQGLLLNPLADPYIIGVSGGAAVGAAVATVFGLSGYFFGFGTPILAFVLALGAVILVQWLARKGGRVPTLSFILAGVVVGSFMWALLTLILIAAPSQGLERIVFWTMGSVAGSDSWARVLILFPFTIAGFMVLFAYSKDLNIFALGEESAKYLGVEVESLKRILIASAALITAAAVSVSGTIGFIGLLVPHIMRRIVGPDHRVLIPCSGLAGAILLISADALARTVIAPTEIPVGVITAMLGAPFFLYLLRKET